MRVYRGRGLGDIYYSLIRDISAGREVTIRGHRLKEIEGPVTLCYTEPGACFMPIPGRKFNIFFALAEVMWMWSGRGDVEWISHYNSNMKSFQDGDNPEFHGAYGLRVRKWKPYWGLSDTASEVDQLEEAIKKIVVDPFTRQAVISLWHPAYDNGSPPTKDTPCNNLVYFSLRDGKLDMTVVIRSNDVIWGTPYNVCQFSHLQAIAVGMLRQELDQTSGSGEPPREKDKVQIGTLTYVVQNLHYYLDQADETRELLIKKATWPVTDPKDFPRGYPGNGPGALKHPLFSVPTPEDFKEAQGMVFSNISIRDKSENPYWDRVIPQMLKAFDVRKTDPTLFDDLVQKAGEPFTSLAYDFQKKTTPV